MNTLTARAESVAAAFWAAHLGCSAGELFSAPFRVIVHGADWADYDGVFALFRGGGAIVSVPSERAGALRILLAPLSAGGSPELLAAILRPVAVSAVGPAYLGYAEATPPPEHPARVVGAEDASALAAMRQECDPAEWMHGGSDLPRPCSAVFVDARIVALAGYEVWGGTVAHLYAITHPAFRGHGFGRSAVAHLAGRALAAGLLPQYRTLASNRASMRLAESLGFHAYATSMAVRLGRSL